MGRCAPLSHDRALLREAQERLDWPRLEDRYVQHLLQGERRLGLDTLLEGLYGRWRLPLALYLRGEPPTKVCHGFVLPHCPPFLAERIQRQWSRIQRLYRDAHWQEAQGAACLSTIWGPLIEYLGDPRLDAVWVEPIRDSHGAMAGLLLQCLPKAYWEDRARIDDLRRAARWAAHALARPERDPLAPLLAQQGHDLRSPLNAIIGYGELLHESLHALQRPQEAEDAQRIVHAGRHLLQRLGDLVDLAKLETGDYPLHTARIAVGDCLRTLHAQWAPQLAERGNRLQLPEDNALQSELDCRLLGRVLSHGLRLLNRAVAGATLHLRQRHDATTLTWHLQPPPGTAIDLGDDPLERRLVDALVARAGGELIWEIAPTPGMTLTLPRWGGEAH